ncbi:MAG: DUF2784 family protein [Xanthomonadales bacterium]|nr:DUF2784 family protein [Xanthomonadales bacterium]
MPCWCCTRWWCSSWSAGCSPCSSAGIRGWRWVRDPVFRLAHLATIGFVVAQTWLGELCPLTVWEQDLRRIAGQETYEGSFVAHWLGRLLYVEAPWWAFLWAYSLFGLAVLLAFLLVPPRRAPALNPIVLATGGGKDSILALDALLGSGRWHVSALLVTVWEGADGSERVAGHGIPLAAVRAQARALGLPLRIMRIPAGGGDRRYREALAEALEQLAWLEPRLAHLAFGDLFLADIRRYREDLLASLGFEAVFPLWGRPTRELAGSFLAAGWRARVVAVDRRRLPPALLGREYDERLLAELPPDCDPCGENGEFHTFVYGGPRFRDLLTLRLGATREEGDLAFLELSAETSA